MRRALLAEQMDRLRYYADVADEVTGPPIFGMRVTMADLDPHYVTEAIKAAEEFRLSWPPREAWEDEVREAGLYG